MPRDYYDDDDDDDLAGEIDEMGAPAPVRTGRGILNVSRREMEDLAVRDARAAQLAAPFKGMVGRVVTFPNFTTFPQRAVLNLITIEGDPQNPRPQRWTINLLRPAMNGSQNQDVAYLRNSRVHLEIAYGTSGAQEIVEVDYPANGGTIEIVAAGFRADAVWERNALGLSPIVGGFAGPSEGGPRDKSLTATRTIFFGDVGGAVAQDIFIRPVPKRSRAFRLHSGTDSYLEIVNSLSALRAMTAPELNELRTYIATNGTFGPFSNEFRPVDQEAWWPLPTWASALHVQVAAEADIDDFSVEFLLDL